MSAIKNHYRVDSSKMKKTDYNNIRKKVGEIFRKNNVEHFAQVALTGLAVEKLIKDMFGDVKSIFVFYLNYSNEFLKLKKRRALSIKKSDNDKYLNTVFIKSLEIIFTEIERISLEVCKCLEYQGYQSLPVPVRCIPGKEDFLPFSLARFGQLAGLGNEGENKCLITPDYGPRIIMGAVLTSFLSEELYIEQIEPCTHCFKCADVCPSGALTGARDKIYFWEKCCMCSLCEIMCSAGKNNYHDSLAVLTNNHTKDKINLV